MRVALTLIIGALAAQPAAASTIQIKSGLVSMSGPLLGVASFSLSGDDFLADATGGVGETGLFSTCYPCGPSQTSFTLGGTVVPSTGFTGGGTYLGTPYSFGFFGEASFSLTLSGPPLLLPPPGPLSIEISGPFSMSGYFSTPSAGPFDLIGYGNVRATLTTNSALKSWEFHSAVWEFADPIPEPATMVLVGTGLAGLLRHARTPRRLRRSRRRGLVDR
jgi:hypothetical protein